MKKIVLLVLVLVMSTGSVMQAAEGPPINREPKSLETEIAKMLKNHNLALEHGMLIDVSLQINRYNEIVVLGVNCGNKQVRDFIARRLNNRVVKFKPDPGLKSFILPVRLEVRN